MRIASPLLLASVASAASFAPFVTLEPNLGQGPRHAAFLARSPGFGAELSANAASIRTKDGPVRISFIGARADRPASPEEPLPSFTTHVGAKTIRAPHYRRVRFPGIYPGIDAVWYSSGTGLEYDFEVAPGADPGRIRLDVAGARVKLDAAGDLVLGEVVQKKPRAYQTIAGRRVDVECRYVARGSAVRFALGPYDRSKPLIVDPIMVSFGRYFKKTAVDADGNIYIAHPAEGIGSADGPVVYKHLNNGTPIFAVALSGTVDQRLYRYVSVAVGPDRSIFLAGVSLRGDLTLKSPLQLSFGGGAADGFVAKIAADGSGLVWSTYLGGSGDDSISSLAIDAAGNAYVAGSTSSPNFPVRNAIQSQLRGSIDGFVAKIAANGTELSYSTYIGGTGGNSAVRAIAMDSAGNLFGAGWTSSTSFPVVKPFQATHGGAATDGMLFRLSAHVNGIPNVAWATYLGGGTNDVADDITVDRFGFPYFVINNAAPLPVVNPIQAYKGSDPYIAKMKPDGSGLVYATYLGGTLWEDCRGLAVDSTGALFVSMLTTSDDYIVYNVPKYGQSGRRGSGALAKLTPAGNSLATSFYVPYVPGFPEPFGPVSVDPAGNAYFAGNKLDNEEKTPYFATPAADALSLASLSWYAVPGTVVYEIQLTMGDKVLFFAGLDAATLSDTTPGVSLDAPAGTVVARIRACQSREMTPGQGYKDCGEPVYRRFTSFGPWFPFDTAVTSPVPGLTLTTPSPTFSWVTSAPRVEVRLSRVGKTVLQSGAYALRLLPLTFDTAGEHTFEMRGCQATSGCEPWTSPIRFTVSAPAAPTEAPASLTASPAFEGASVSWQGVARATDYTVQLIQPASGPGGGALTVASKRLPGTLVTIPAPAGFARAIVRGCNPSGCGPWSQSVEVNVPAPNPATPVLGYLVDGSVNDSSVAAWSWSRIPGDNGSNTTYRLYVFSVHRQTVALDIQTTSNFWAARIPGDGASYSAQVIATQNGTAYSGPPLSFVMAGASPRAPNMTLPTYGSTNWTPYFPIGWSEVPDARLYEYYVTRPGLGGPTYQGVTASRSVNIPARAVNGAPTTYDAIVRACTGGTGPADCTWGPWSIDETGLTRFTTTQ